MTSKFIKDNEVVLSYFLVTICDVQFLSTVLYYSGKVMKMDIIFTFLTNIDLRLLDCGMHIVKLVHY
jgi:hypothetical protein